MSSSAEITKATQKVKEAMSRMNKNGLAFCIVNLEAMEYTDLMTIIKSTLDFKSGKDSYMCDGKLICLVSYEENDKMREVLPDSEHEVVIIDPTIKDVTENRINIAINIADELFLSEHAGYVGYGSLDRNGNDPELPMIQLDGFISYLSAFKECVDALPTAYENNPSRSMQTLMTYAFVDETPFKTIDEVIKRFYDLMRERGLLLDEEEEDLGAMADAAGIEW